MNKAILVMDMPESCNKCPCFHGFYSDMYCGALNDRTIDYPYPEDFRQDWCPLNPFPEQYDIEAEKNKPHDRDYNWEFEYGYNTCLQEILKGED